MQQLRQVLSAQTWSTSSSVRTSLWTRLLLVAVTRMVPAASSCTMVGDHITCCSSLHGCRQRCRHRHPNLRGSGRRTAGSRPCSVARPPLRLQRPSPEGGWVAAAAMWHKIHSDSCLQARQQHARHVPRGRTAPRWSLQQAGRQRVLQGAASAIRKLDRGSQHSSRMHHLQHRQGSKRVRMKESIVKAFKCNK